MPTMILLLIYLLIGAAALTIGIVIAFAFGSCAAQKGYSKGKYFWVSLSLGLLGGCLVAALPDRTLNEQVSRINAQLSGR